MMKSRIYTLEELLEDNLRAKELLEKMAAAFAKWPIEGKRGILAEVRAFLDKP